jgi:hypothetical protein
MRSATVQNPKHQERMLQLKNEHLQLREKNIECLKNELLDIRIRSIAVHEMERDRLSSYFINRSLDDLFD